MYYCKGSYNILDCGVTVSLQNENGTGLVKNECFCMGLFEHYSMTQKILSQFPSTSLLCVFYFPTQGLIEINKIVYNINSVQLIMINSRFSHVVHKCNLHARLYSLVTH